jgi:paraquat-inducible protein A
MAEIVTCRTCGLVQEVKSLPWGWVAKCARCGFTVAARKPNSRTRTGALALAALILYFPANYYPIVRTYYWGVHDQTTIFDGIKSLFQTGSYFVASLVFTTSILTPGLKIIGLLTLAFTANSARLRQTRTWVYRIIQFVDPWNMLEVTLLSILVALAELGSVATVHPGAGVLSFGGVVLFTILATITFDPRLVWDEPEKAEDK